MQPGGGSSRDGGAPPPPQPQSQSQSQSQFAEMMVVEAASPISSRPPAASNLEEFVRLSTEEDGGGGGGGGSGGGGSGGGLNGGNRWPRQETLALLKIRSDMDTAFRDATVKGPLWEDVSRKLGEQGYKRNAKKCKEKFENVHKYYKRTKEGRGGRQDGKTYKFFSELEAFSSTPTTLDVAPVSVGIPSAPNNNTNNTQTPPPLTPPVVIPMTVTKTTASQQQQQHMFPPNFTLTMPPPVVLPVPVPVPVPVTATSTPTTIPFRGISFSSNSTSSTSDGEEEETVSAGSRKRKRNSGSGKMTEFFESLLRKVIDKQEAMQKQLLETIEKKEKERLVREEAWKRQEMSRLAQEQELMAQERAVSATRDAAIISFLQKITGHTIHLPSTSTSTQTHPHPPPSPSPPPPSSHKQPQTPMPPPPPNPPPPTQQESYSDQTQITIKQQQLQLQLHQQSPSPSQLVMSGGTSGSSSRWPKTEVIALINMRSGLDQRYQEAGPKGPLWEEISKGMQRLGYSRSAKRCKEKWENINKYFKKVKESNKKRPQDAKTCPYFHQLDQLYHSKTTALHSPAPNQQQQQLQSPPSTQPENKHPENGSGIHFGEGNKPEDLVRKMMEQHRHQQLVVDDYDKIEEHESDNDLDQDDYDDEEDEDDDDQMEEVEKMGYKIEFKRQNTNALNG